MKKDNRIKTYQVFAFALLISLASLLPILIHYSGNLYLVGDYMTQQIPFIKEGRRMFLSGTPFWSWNTFLGANYIGTYSFYVYGSPFFWPLLLIPERFLGIGLTAMFVLKHAVAASTAFVFLRKHLNSAYYAAAGAFMYAFSFFTMDSSFYYHFIDVIAFFPLVLYFTDLVLEKKKCYMLFLVSLLCAVINYYFYISTSLLFLIYLVARVKGSGVYKFKDAFRCILFYGFGGLAAAFILLPSALTLLETNKATESHNNVLLSGYYAIPQIFKMIKGMILPSEGILGSATGFRYGMYCSSTAFLPLFGAFFWIIALRDGNKRRETQLMKACIILTLVPFGNGIFSLFSNMAYSRWWYGLVLIFTLVSMQTVEQIRQSGETPIKNYKFAGWTIAILSVVFFGLLGIAKYIYVYVLHRPNEQKVISFFARYFKTSDFADYFHKYDFRYMIVLGILILLSYGVLFVCIKKKWIFSPKKIAAITAVVCMLSYSLYLCNESVTYKEQNVKYVSAQAQTEQTVYRSRTLNKRKYANYGMIVNRPTASTFNSFKSHATSQFCRIAGYQVGSAPSTPGFFDTEAIETVLNTREVMCENGEIKRAEYYVPFGYTYNYYAVDDGLKFTANRAENNRRIELMTKACYVDRENEEKVKGLLEKVDENEKFDWREESQKRKASACTSFEMDSTGFSAVSLGENRRLVYFSVPNDTGWKITVNGKATDIVEVNGRMIGLIVPAGMAEIEAKFVPPGLKVGGVISAATFIGVSAYCLILGLKKKKA